MQSARPTTAMVFGLSSEFASSREDCFFTLLPFFFTRFAFVEVDRIFYPKSTIVMSAKDIFHETIKLAIIKDGWTITSDPKFQSTFLYARVSARAVREELVKAKGYDEAQLPSRETIGAVLNRMGYRLKKHKRQNP